MFDVLSTVSVNYKFGVCDYCSEPCAKNAMVFTFNFLHEELRIVYYTFEYSILQSLISRCK